MNDFRENRTRARDLKTRKDKSVSHFIERVRSGDTFYAHLCEISGKVTNFKISVSTISEGDSVPINIEVDKGDSKLEINRSLHLGVNILKGFDVEEGNIIFIKGRTLVNQSFKARDLTVNFDVVSRQ